MKDKPDNLQRARLMVDAFAESGIRQCILCAGSRNTPLTLAFWEHNDITIYRHRDERSAGFVALGQSKRSGFPTVLVSTSGTAAGEFHPAVTEADASSVPLIVITADRPWELHDSGANQTINQTQLFSTEVRWFKNFSDSCEHEHELQSWGLNSTRAVKKSLTAPAGPVHINIPFRKPLEPDPETTNLSSNHTENNWDSINWSRGTITPSPTAIQQLAAEIENTERGLILCGPSDGSQEFHSDLLNLSTRIDYPILADILSNIPVESTSAASCLQAYESYLQHIEIEPELILHIQGSINSSRELIDFLDNTNAKVVHVNAAGDLRGKKFNNISVIESEPGEFLETLTDELPKIERSSSWASMLQKRERQYWHFIEDRDENITFPFQGFILRSIVKQIPSGSNLLIANSLPIRDANKYVDITDTYIQTYGNRGASGIDGTIGTTAGIATSTSDRWTFVVLGDTAAYHDLNSLLFVSEYDLKIGVIIINNDGGGIFQKLPVNEFEPPYTELFQMPHEINFDHAAQTFGLPYTQASNRDEFDDALRQSMNENDTFILEIKTDAHESHEFRERLQSEFQNLIT